MLEELSIRGIGGIKSASLAFGGEFIVITGESGAGKGRERRGRGVKRGPHPGDTGGVFSLIMKSNTGKIKLI